MIINNRLFLSRQGVDKKRGKTIFKTNSLFTAISKKICRRR